MSTELFVDGICELDDRTLQSYFSRFGSRITNYEAHRQRPTNSCCFALISFVSHHTVNAILRQRPHEINSYSLFVKRILPSSACSFIERLLPVSSLFVYNKISKQFDQDKLKTYFKTFGRILKFEHDHSHNRLSIEYDDYDAVDTLFLRKDQLPNYLDIHKNILPRAQSTIAYHGTCRRKQQENTEEKKKKKRQQKKKTTHLDKDYQNLLQKTIENLGNCKAQLGTTENDYAVLQMEYATIKKQYDQLLDDQNKTIIKRCPSCQEHEATIAKLQQTLIKHNEQYETIRSQYQRLLSTQFTSPRSSKSECNSPMRHRHYVLSNRLNNDQYTKNEVSDNCLSQCNLPTPGICDIVSKQDNSPLPTIRSWKQPHRVTYQYESVNNDEE